jgi:hypothetical protein
MAWLPKLASAARLNALAKACERPAATQLMLEPVPVHLPVVALLVVVEPI